MHYLSIWWLNSQSYGAARLSREITDAWIAQKWELGGLRFTPDVPELSDAEVASVAGGRAALGQLDEIQWEVLERSGDKMIIKRDEEKFWAAQAGHIGETFNALKNQHAELIGRSCSSGRDEQENSGDSGTASNTGPSTESSADRTELESIAKLEELRGIDAKVPSEVANVELVHGKDNSIWLISGQDKTLGKHVILGGVGTGQWVPEGEAFEESIPFKMDSDRTFVQLDEGSFANEAQGVSTLTLYKMLHRAETDKGVTEHKISFLNVQRPENMDAGCDSFEVKIKSPMNFNCIVNPDKITCKNFFSKCLTALKTCEQLLMTYRFRFERVGQSFKIQRPYVVTAHSISLKKDKPLLVSKP